MNETFITLVGNAVSDVRVRATEGGIPFATFRMASNPRRFDRESARWVDGDPIFVTVVCWRTLAENVATSIGSGDPIVVHGRLRVTDWEANDRKGTSVDIDAVAVGHDMARGTSKFTRIRRVAPEQALTAAVTTGEVEVTTDPWNAVA